MSNKLIKLNKTQILSYQKNRPPYLMVDYISKLIPEKISIGSKNLKRNEWFFKVHWKNDPNMPGMLQIESLVQTAALAILYKKENRGKAMYLVSADQIRFFSKVKPNCKLTIKTRIISWKRGIALCYGESFVNKMKVCSANFTLVLPEKILKVK
jgi:3-hydroxyacyl-[acyl-carrier-protein] dehydratase